MLIVEGSRGLAIGQMEEMPDTHHERSDFMRSLGRAAAVSGKVGRLKQVFFISEGWMSMAGPDKPPYMRPSQDPDRKEVLIISGLELKGRKTRLRIFDMVRNGDHDVVDLPELAAPQGSQETAQMPLLDAFAQGYHLAFQAQVS
jgi:hypothetical protein